MQKESYLEKWGISVYGALEKIITASGISEDQDIYVVNHVQTPFQAYHSQDSAIKAIISALLPKKYLDRVRSEKVNPEKPIEASRVSIVPQVKNEIIKVDIKPLKKKTKVKKS